MIPLTVLVMWPFLLSVPGEREGESFGIFSSSSKDTGLIELGLHPYDLISPFSP